MSDLICPYICDNKTEYGYCKTTACINHKYNQNYIVSNHTLTNEELKKIQQEREKGGVTDTNVGCKKKGGVEE